MTLDQINDLIGKFNTLLGTSDYSDEWRLIGDELTIKMLSLLSGSNLSPKALTENGLSGSVIKMPKSKDFDRMKVVLSDITQEHINSPVEIFKGRTLYPVPSKITSLDLAKHGDYFLDMGTTGHFLRLSSSALVVRAMVGVEMFRGCPLIRNLAYYVNKLNGYGGDGTKFGRVRINLNDTLSGFRILVLLQGTIFWADAFHKAPHLISVVLEIVRFLFISPHYHSKLIKDWLTPILHMACSRSKSGRRVEWDVKNRNNNLAILSGYRIADVNMNDEPVYQTMLQVINDSIDEIGKKMPSLAKWCLSSFSMSPEDMAIDHVIIEGVAACAGYTRTRTVEAHEKTSIKKFIRDEEKGQSYPVRGIRNDETIKGYWKDMTDVNTLVSEEVENRVRKGYYKELHQDSDDGKTRDDYKEKPFRDLVEDAPYIPSLKMEWRKFIEWAERKNKLLSWDEMEKRFPLYVTSKSAGGSAHSAKLDVLVRETSKRYRIKFNSKREIFFIMGEDVFDYVKFKKGYTLQTPGNLAGRDVVFGRMRRGVYMLHYNSFAYETALAIPLMDYMFTKDYNDTYEPFGPGDFTPGMSTGNELIDHAKGIAASGMGNFLILMMDYSAFDFHQTWNNMRKHITETLSSFFREKSLKFDGGPFDDREGYATYIEELFGEHQRKDVVYLTRDQRGMDEDTYLLLDMLLSGEFMTININSLTNRALFRRHLAKIDANPKLSGKMILDTIGIQGDDSYTLFSVSNSKDWNNPEIYDELSRELETSSGENGQDLNPHKTGKRRTAYEYLKVKSVFGFPIPLLHIQILSTELPRVDINPLEALRGYRNTLALTVARGHDAKLMHRCLMYTWLTYRSLRFLYNDEQYRYIYPFACICVPQRENGIGSLPWTVLGSSIDALIALECSENSDLENDVNHAADVTRIKLISSNADALLSSLLRNEFRPGIDNMLKHLHSDTERENASLNAINRLKRARAPEMKGLTYLESAYEIAKQTSENIGEIRRIRDADKQQLGVLITRTLTGSDPDAVVTMKKYPSRYKINEEFSWVFSMTLTDIGEIPRRTDELMTPYPIWNYEMQEAVRVFGIGVDADIANLNPDRVMGILRKSKYFPRHITAKKLFKYLSHSYFLKHPDKILDVLVAMGVDDNVAQLFSNQFNGKYKTWAFLMVVNTFSTADPFTSKIDLSKEIIDEITKLDSTMEYMYLLRFIAAFKSLMWGLKSGHGFRKYHPEITKETFVGLAKAISRFGVFVPEAYLDMFPESQ